MAFLKETPLRALYRLPQYIRKFKGVWGTGLTNKINLVLNTIEREYRRARLLSHPVMVDIVPTMLCNLRCIFCIQYASSGVKELSLEEFKVIAKTFFSYTARVSFCSDGEPFLNKHFMEFLSICRKSKVFVVIVSNGTLLTEEICKEILLNGYIESFSFSFDGARKETVESIRRGIDYQKVVDNMQMMGGMKRKYRLKSPSLEIRYTIMRKNAEELPDLIRHAGEWGMDRVVASYLFVANDIDRDESLFYHPELAKRIFEEASKVAREKNIHLELPELPGAKKSITPCIYPWGFVKITPDGEVRFCYRAYNRPIHNIFETSDFLRLWNSDKYQLIRKTVNSDKPYFKYCSICHTRTGMGMETSHIKWLREDLYDFDKEYEK